MGLTRSFLDFFDFLLECLFFRFFWSCSELELDEEGVSEDDKLLSSELSDSVEDESELLDSDESEGSELEGLSFLFDFLRDLLFTWSSLWNIVPI
jgi:hypothetical protein